MKHALLLNIDIPEDLKMSLKAVKDEIQSNLEDIGIDFKSITKVDKSMLTDKDAEPGEVEQDANSGPSEQEYKFCPGCGKKKAKETDSDCYIEVGEYGIKGESSNEEKYDSEFSGIEYECEECGCLFYMGGY